MCSASESSGSEKVWIREEGGYQDFPSNVFYLTVPNISVGGVFSVSFISLWKIWIREDGDIKIFLRIFWSHSPEIFRRGILWCFIHFGYRKCLDRRRGGFQDLPSSFFLSHSAEHFRRGNPLVIHSSRVWKLLDKRGWGYHDFPSNVFYLTVPNISVGGVFSVSFISLWKIWNREDGEIKIFFRFFLTQSAEFFLRGDPLLFH